MYAKLFELISREYEFGVGTIVGVAPKYYLDVLHRKAALGMNGRASC